LNFAAFAANEAAAAATTAATVNVLRARAFTL
jgi:hypothetical protein